MAELPPFGPGRAPGDLTYDSAPPRVAIPLLILRRRHLLEDSRARDCTGGRTGMHPTQWTVYSAWPAPRILAMYQCKHRAPAGSNTGLWREHRTLCTWCSAEMAHTESTLNLSNLYRRGMLCTYMHLRIDMDLSTPLLRDEHNSRVNSMQQIL